MKTIAQIACNFFAKIPESAGPLMPQIEVAITTAEAEYHMPTADADDLSKRLRLETFRFIADPSLLRSLAHQLESAADRAEDDLAKCLSDSGNDESKQIFRMLGLPSGDFGALENYAIRKSEIERENERLRGALKAIGEYRGEGGPGTPWRDIVRDCGETARNALLAKKT